MRLAVLVPVKDLSQAKTRLQAVLSPAHRRALAELLLRGVLHEISRLPATVENHTLQKTLVTSYEPAKVLARRHGFEVLEEPSQNSESDSVDWASAVLQRRNIDGVLRIPLDLPLVRTVDLDSILVRARLGLNCVMVPSLDGTGTNALYRSPPCLFPSQFGPNSLAKHLSLARSTARAFQVQASPALALDLDDPADLEKLLQSGHPCPALAFLRERGLKGPAAARQERPFSGH